MHLMASRDGRVADDRAQSAPVLIDMRAIVADPITEVEAFEGPGTHATEAAKETVREPRLIPRGENRY